MQEGTCNSRTKFRSHQSKIYLQNFPPINSDCTVDTPPNSSMDHELPHSGQQLFRKLIQGIGPKTLGVGEGDPVVYTKAKAFWKENPFVIT